jgi:hypothetical protein
VPDPSSSRLGGDDEFDRLARAAATGSLRFQLAIAPLEGRFPARRRAARGVVAAAEPRRAALDGCLPRQYRRGDMKFHATVIFEFNAADVGEAGRRLNELLDKAREHELEARSLELSTPPGTPVTLPPVASPGRP